MREQILIDCQLEKQSGKPFFTVPHLGGNDRLQRGREKLHRVIPPQIFQIKINGIADKIVP